MLQNLPKFQHFPPLLAFLMLISSGCVLPSAETRRVWEKIEITLAAEDTCSNPYTDVEVWVDLRGPGFNKRCYGFWDGGNTFKIRILATAPGAWTWKSGASRNDPGLTGIRRGGRGERRVSSVLMGPWNDLGMSLGNPGRHIGLH